MKTAQLRRMSGVCCGVCAAGVLLGTGCVDDRESAGSESVAAITLDPNADYQFVGVQSGKCVGIVGDTTAPNTRLEIRTCTGVTSQRFHPEALTGGFFRLRSVLSGLCVDVSARSPLDGAPVIQFECNGGPNQSWSFTDLASGAERITVRHSGKVLDVTGNGSADGTLIEQWASNGGTNQQFTLVQTVAPLQ